MLGALVLLAPPGALAQTTGPGATPTPLPPKLVVIQGKRFHNRLITVAVGQTITWKNADRVAHNVTSTRNLFASGELAPISRPKGASRYGPGGSFNYVFDRPGFYSYRCTLTGTAGQIIVLP